ARRDASFLLRVGLRARLPDALLDLVLRLAELLDGRRAMAAVVVLRGLEVAAGGLDLAERVPHLGVVLGERDAGPGHREEDGESDRAHVASVASSGATRHHHRRKAG